MLGFDTLQQAFHSLQEVDRARSADYSGQTSFTKTFSEACHIFYIDNNDDDTVSLSFKDADDTVLYSCVIDAYRSDSVAMFDNPYTKITFTVTLGHDFVGKGLKLKSG